MFDLDDLVEPTGLVVRVANAIDDDGIIVANATDAEGRQHSVALLPMKDDSH